jgi:adenylosuccinate synthase
MTITAVVGAQWGDEAKGKLVDLLAGSAQVVARFNGGDNAGHTVVNDYGTFKLRLTPNGFYHPRTQCVIGPGVVVNLATLLGEIEMIQKAGIDLKDRLWISPRCHVVMPYHPLVDEIYEKARGQAQTGTTRRGMGPVYADKVSYNGIRLYDLADPEVFAEKLGIQLALKNPLLKAFGAEFLEFGSVFQEKLDQYARIQQWVREPFGMVQEVIEKGGHILLEGAQGALLDNNWGTYPFCTASVTLAGGAAAGLGIAPRQITRVVNVAKAYTTRVGAGPMPTELKDETGIILQKEGQEFGTVTGRARRCGWFDAELVRFTTQLNGATEVALTKLDVLDTLPVVQICIGYKRAPEDGRLLRYWEGDARWLEECQPVYLEMEGWMESTRKLREFGQLPSQAQAYVQRIEELVGAPVSYVSVGPARDETIRMASS